MTSKVSSRLAVIAFTLLILDSIHIIGELAVTRNIAFMDVALADSSSSRINAILRIYLGNRTIGETSLEPTPLPAQDLFNTLEYKLLEYTAIARILSIERGYYLAFNTSFTEKVNLSNDYEVAMSILTPTSIPFAYMLNTSKGRFCVSGVAIVYRFITSYQVLYAALTAINQAIEANGQGNYYVDGFLYDGENLTFVSVFARAGYALDTVPCFKYTGWVFTTLVRSSIDNVTSIMDTTLLDVRSTLLDGVNGILDSMYHALYHKYGYGPVLEEIAFLYDNASLTYLVLDGNLTSNTISWYLVPQLSGAVTPFSREVPLKHSNAAVIVCNASEHATSYFDDTCLARKPSSIYDTIIVEPSCASGNSICYSDNISKILDYVAARLESLNLSQPTPVEVDILMAEAYPWNALGKVNFASLVAIPAYRYLLAVKGLYNNSAILVNNVSVRVEAHVQVFAPTSLLLPGSVTVTLYTAHVNATTRNLTLAEKQLVENGKLVSYNLSIGFGGELTSNYPLIDAILTRTSHLLVPLHAYTDWYLAIVGGYPREIIVTTSELLFIGESEFDLGRYDVVTGYNMSALELVGILSHTAGEPDYYGRVHLQDSDNGYEKYASLNFTVNFHKFYLGEYMDNTLWGARILCNTSNVSAALVALSTVLSASHSNIVYNVTDQNTTRTVASPIPSHVAEGVYQFVDNILREGIVNPRNMSVFVGYFNGINSNVEYTVKDGYILTVIGVSIIVSDSLISPPIPIVHLPLRMDVRINGSLVPVSPTAAAGSESLTGNCSVEITSPNVVGNLSVAVMLGGQLYPVDISFGLELGNLPAMIARFSEEVTGPVDVNGIVYIPFQAYAPRYTTVYTPQSPRGTIDYFHILDNIQLCIATSMFTLPYSILVGETPEMICNITVALSSLSAPILNLYLAAERDSSLRYMVAELLDSNLYPAGLLDLTMIISDDRGAILLPYMDQEYIITHLLDYIVFTTTLPPDILSPESFVLLLRFYSRKPGLYRGLGMLVDSDYVVVVGNGVLRIENQDISVGPPTAYMLRLHGANVRDIARYLDKWTAIFLGPNAPSSYSELVLNYLGAILKGVLIASILPGYELTAASIHNYAVTAESGGGGTPPPR